MKQIIKAASWNNFNRQEALVSVASARKGWRVSHTMPITVPWSQEWRWTWHLAHWMHVFFLHTWHLSWLYAPVTWQTPSKRTTPGKHGVGTAFTAGQSESAFSRQRLMYRQNSMWVIGDSWEWQWSCQAATMVAFRWLENSASTASSHGSWEDMSPGNDRRSMPPIPAL